MDYPPGLPGWGFNTPQHLTGIIDEGRTISVRPKRVPETQDKELPLTGALQAGAKKTPYDILGNFTYDRIGVSWGPKRPP